jgi:hypothetical protein
MHSTEEVGGRQAANIFYLLLGTTSAITSTALGLLANQIKAAWGTEIVRDVNSHWSLDDVVITMVDGSEVQGIDTSAAVPGTNAADALPPGMSACVSWHINAAYRGGHPRTYMPGLSANQLSGIGSNEFSTAVAIQIANDWDNFLADVNALTLETSSVTMGTVSYTRAKAPRTVPVFFSYINGLTRVNTRMASQRRRLGKLSIGTYQT